MALPLSVRTVYDESRNPFRCFTLSRSFVFEMYLYVAVRSHSIEMRNKKNTGRIECSTGRSTSTSSQLLTVLGSLIFRSPPLARLKVDDIQLEIVTPDSSVQLQNDYSKPFCVLQEPRSEAIAFGVTSSVCLL